MKRLFSMVLLLAALPAAAQWSTNFNTGWVGNVSSDWVKSLDGVPISDKSFSLWGNGWQAGGGLEYRAKDWLAYGVCGSYQIFNTEPSGHIDPQIADGFSYTWSGESSWQAPVSGYVRLIKPRAIMGTNLKLGLGVMASHIGQLTLISEGGYTGTTHDTVTVSGTGETVYRPFGQISAGIKFPLTSRIGITFDYGFLMAFDKKIMEMPLELGVAIKW